MNKENGMQDIGSMQMGVFLQNSDMKTKKKGFKWDMKLSPKMIAALAVIVVVFIVLFLVLPETVAKNHAQKAAMEIFSGLFGEEIQWDKYYSEEYADLLEKGAEVIAKEIKEIMEETGSDADDILDNMKVKEIKKVKVKENKAFLKKTVKTIYKDNALDEPKKIRISKGYVVNIEWEGENEAVYVLILKVNGKYGVYDLGDSENFDENLEL